MTNMEIGRELVALCRQGKNQEAIDRFYSPNIESVEPVAMPGMEQTQRGTEKIKGKNQWWVDNHEVHGCVAEGPFPHGDRFIVRFKYDVTPKHTGKRMTLMKLVSTQFKTEKSSRRSSSTQCQRRTVGHIDLGWRTCLTTNQTA